MKTITRDYKQDENLLVLTRTLQAIHSMYGKSFNDRINYEIKKIIDVLEKEMTKDFENGLDMESIDLIKRITYIK